MLELGVLHHPVLLEVHGVDIGSSDVHLAHRFEFCVHVERGRIFKLEQYVK